MQKLKNIEDIVLQLKPLLRRYLEENSTHFKGTLFTCPNRAFHKNDDSTPSAGFVPGTNEQVFNCFSCGNSGDIFSAYSLLEGEEITGANWYNAVKKLADRYSIYYEVEPLSSEEQIHANIQQFLQELIKLAHKNLLTNQKSRVWDYIRIRKWENAVPYFSFGYLEETEETKDFFKEWFGNHPELVNFIALTPSQLYGRLIYPIKHKYGVILGVGSRRITSNEDEPKYIKHILKTMEKGGVLFNLTKKFKTIYLVEGASSVFTLHSHGVENVVAMLGKSFTQAMYNSFIKNGIEKVVFCFDGDTPGIEGLNDALNLTQNKFDIKISVKFLPLGKDPDDIVNDLGIEEFKKISEVSNFKYQLNRLKSPTDENYDNLKKSVFDIIISCKDSLIQDKMIKMFIEEIGVSKTKFQEELARYESTKGLVSDLGVSEVIAEETSLLKSIETFEERALRSGELKGVATGFPIFDEKIDGLNKGLILVAGRWNTGKSAFLGSMILNLLKDPTNYVLYFSIDDPAIYTTIPRFLANLSMIPINTVSNPIHRINQNETLAEAEKLVLKGKREEGISLLKSYSGRLGIKDSADGSDMAFIEKTIRVYKSIAQDKNLIVFVDFLNMVTLNKKNVDRTETETQLALFFKHISGVYQVPVVCTVESTKGVAKTTIDESTGVKGSSSIQFRSDLTLLLYSDFEVDPKSDMYFYDEQGEANPIVGIKVTKNKFSSFRRTLYYRFYRNFAKFVECTSEEQLDYGRKI